jgi:hypothetical protein
MKGTGQSSAMTFRIVCRGTARDVRLGPDASAEYENVLQLAAKADEIAVKRKTHTERYFRELCDHLEFHRRLSHEKFKKEGNFADGHHGMVAVWALKSWQWRLYGAFLSVGGSGCFVGMKVDASKKQDRADAELLKASARDIGNLLEYRPWKQG